MEKSILISDSFKVENVQEDIFSKYAESYDNVVARTSFYKKLISNAVRSLEGCKRVVDFGCATGNLAIELAKRGVNVLAIDNNQAMIERARKKIEKEGLGKYVEVINADITKITLEPGGYDGAVMLNVMYLLDNPYDLADKIYASLKKDGILVVSGPKPNQNLNLLQKTIYQEFQRAGILEKFSEDIKIVRDVNEILEKNIKHFFTTERLQEILVDFCGFSDVIVNDLMPGYRTYLGQGHFIVVRKKNDYYKLSPEQIKIRFAKDEEMQKLYRIRYHFTKERFGVLESTKEQDAKMVEWDKFDDNSVHLVTEHGGKILATIRFVMDSKDLGLPADTQQNLDYLRKNGKVVWEPGRWISLPFAPRGTGRKVLRAGYEYAKKQGITHIVSIMEIGSTKLYKEMGFLLDKITSGKVDGYNTEAYIEISPVDNPPKFFTEEINDPAVLKFLESLEKETMLINRAVILESP
ncbi:MAG: GNAT family N-acetyltransferase [Nanoarchaeota archaeon]